MANLTKEIEALLPQIQCAKCGYDGCFPYAKAINAGEAPINLCPPGGKATIKALANALDLEVLEPNWEQDFSPNVVAINEEDCIGCTKCIQACPVDAIIGAAKLMHTVLSDICTGCMRCIEPCPVDCIDILAMPPEINKEQSRKNYHTRQERINRPKAVVQLQEEDIKHDLAKLLQRLKTTNT